VSNGRNSKKHKRLPAKAGLQLGIGTQSVKESTQQWRCKMSGGTRIKTGAYIGTGTAFNIRSVGFRPKLVQLFNSSGLVVATWDDKMPDASAFKQINHADTQNVYVTSNGITPLSDGFTVGTDADLNTDAETVTYIAHE
jgi:hypothetical protein